MKSKIIIAFLIIVADEAMAQLNVPAAEALLHRVLPQHALQFAVEPLSSSTGKDVFEIESRNNKIILRGNNGVAVASALYYKWSHK